MQAFQTPVKVIETGDDVEGYSFTTAYDTTIGNQGISIFAMTSKSDYIDDADSFSNMFGLSGFFSSGDRSIYNYSHTLSDAKGNHNSSDETANETNAIGHTINLGHDFMQQAKLFQQALDLDTVYPRIKLV